MNFQASSAYSFGKTIKGNFKKQKPKKILITIFIQYRETRESRSFNESRPRRLSARNAKENFSTLEVNKTYFFIFKKNIKNCKIESGQNKDQEAIQRMFQGLDSIISTQVVFQARSFL